MEQEKALRLLTRQVRDIQAQADKIINGENSPEAIEAFAKYSLELKEYIYKNIESIEIKSFVYDLPDIDYERTQLKPWQYLLIIIMPVWWIALYKDYVSKNQAIEEIKSTRGKYATLELLVKGTMN
jgi:hypothetical protein